MNSAFHANENGRGDVTQRSHKKTAARETSYFMARLQASPSLLYGRPAALVHGKILCSMTAVYPGADPGGGCRGCASLPPPAPEMPCGFLIQLVGVFCINICLRHQSVTPFLSGEPCPKKNPGSPSDILRQRGRRRRIGRASSSHIISQTMQTTVCA